MAVKFKHRKLLKILKIKVFGILNIFDVAVIGLFALALLVAFLTHNSKFSASGEVIQDRIPVEIDVLFEEEKISRNEEIFVPGEQTFITIRNVPYTKLDIVKTKKTSYVTGGASVPYTFNYLVTVSDKAVVTTDGPVIGGNKIKIGLPIVLEGYNYKLSGIVTDVRINKNQ